MIYHMAWMCNVQKCFESIQELTLRLCVSNLLCCFADVDSCAGVGSQWWFLFWLCAALQFVLCDLQPPHQPFGGRNTPDVPASLLYHLCSNYCDGSVTQAVVSGSAQHVPPLCCCDVSSDGQSRFREVPQENAALEPEPLQTQQAASVRRQPRPGAQHSLSGVLTLQSPPVRPGQTEIEMKLQKRLLCMDVPFLSTL